MDPDDRRPRPAKRGGKQPEPAPYSSSAPPLCQKSEENDRRCQQEQDVIEEIPHGGMERPRAEDCPSGCVTLHLSFRLIGQPIQLRLQFTALRSEYIGCRIRRDRNRMPEQECSTAEDERHLETIPACEDFFFE